MAMNATMFRFGQTVGPLTMGALLAFGGMDAVFLGGGAIGLFTVVVLIAQSRA